MQTHMPAPVSEVVRRSVVEKIGCVVVAAAGGEEDEARLDVVGDCPTASESDVVDSVQRLRRRCPTTPRMLRVAACSLRLWQGTSRRHRTRVAGQAVDHRRPCPLLSSALRDRRPARRRISPVPRACRPGQRLPAWLGDGGGRPAVHRRRRRRWRRLQQQPAVQG